MPRSLALAALGLCCLAAPAQAAFDTPRYVSPAGENAYDQAVDVSPNGRAVIAWRAEDGAVKVARRATPNGPFAAPETIAGSDVAANVQAVISDTGSVTVAWSENGLAAYATSPDDEAPIGAADVLAGTAAPALGEDGAGNALLAVEDGAFVVLREAQIGVDFSGTSDSAPGSKPAIAGYGNGGFVFAYLDADTVKAQVRAPGGAVGAADTLSAATVSTTPVAAVGPTGRAVVAWERGGAVEAALRTGGAWAAAAQLSSAGDARAPLVAVDELGVVMAVYSRVTAPNTAEVDIRIAPAGGPFGGEQALSGAEAQPDIRPLGTALAVAPDGTTAVAWAPAAGQLRVRTLAADAGAFDDVVELAHGVDTANGERPSASISAAGVTTLAYRKYTGSGTIHRIEYTHDGGATPVEPGGGGGGAPPAPAATQPVTPAPAPAPPVAPTPAPPAPQVVIPAEVLGLRELHRLRPSFPKRVVLDFGPVARGVGLRIPRHGLIDPEKDAVRDAFSIRRHRDGYRYWSVGRVRNAIRRLQARKIYVQPTFHPMPRKQVHASFGDVEPYQVYTQDWKPARQQAYGGGQEASPEYPAWVELYYWDPEEDKGDILREQERNRLSACAELNETLGTGADFDANTENLISRFRRDGCDVQVTFETVRRNGPAVPRITRFEVGPYRDDTKLRKASWARITVTRSQVADLALEVRPAGTERILSLDQDWQLPAMPRGGGDGAAFDVAVLDRGARSDASGRLGTPIAGVTVTGWFDPAGGSDRTRKVFEETTRYDRAADAVRTPRIKVVLDEPGTLRIEATGTPAEGSTLQGWTELKVAPYRRCVTGVSGWAWRYDGSSRYDRVTSCGGASRGLVAEAAFLDGIVSGLARMFGQLFGQPTILDEPAPAAERLRRAESRGVLPSQLAMGAPLSADPTPPVTRSGGIIAAGGGNLAQQRALGVYGGQSSRLVDLGADGTALVGSAIVSRDSAGIIAAGGGNIIAAGGGNIIAAGGGNIIAAGGGNIIAAGGGNLVDVRKASIIAAGGGNIIAAGGGNLTVAPIISRDSAGIIAAGGGNIIAAGGGNIIAAGGGN